MRDCTKYVGLDAHKSTVAVAIAGGDRTPPVSCGLIENLPEAITRLSKGDSVRFCSEAGPCGHEVHRQITVLGHQCDVVAPSLIPHKAGDRVKTARRDALSLARLEHPVQTYQEFPSTIDASWFVEQTR
jgi:transposase